ncbi:MAG: hypothetical protein JKY28_06055 [Sulfurimonas sp.]|nr:hypothetical protein [Sulfurimonas sp.]
MFDFLDNDWFIISLEIVFLILIIYDIRQYRKTKKREYITNIVLTLGFALWVLYPMYTSYFGWQDKQKSEMILQCNENNNTELCKCVKDSIFKEYTFSEYKTIDKNSTTYIEFLLSHFLNITLSEKRQFF